jgi:hypothetical protein
MVSLVTERLALYPYQRRPRRDDIEISVDDPGMCQYPSLCSSRVAPLA